MRGMSTSSRYIVTRQIFLIMAYDHFLKVLDGFLEVTLRQAGIKLYNLVSAYSEETFS